MQNDLISRSALIEHLRAIKTVYGVPMTNRDKQVIHWVIGHIKDEPTAYDVDKVVEQLEEEINNECDEAVIQAYEYAIKIVKAGGTDEG